MTGAYYAYVDRLELRVDGFHFLIKAVVVCDDEEQGEHQGKKMNKREEFDA